MKTPKIIHTGTLACLVRALLCSDAQRRLGGKVLDCRDLSCDDCLLQDGEERAITLLLNLIEDADAS